MLMQPNFFTTLQNSTDVYCLPVKLTLRQEFRGNLFWQNASKEVNVCRKLIVSKLLKQKVDGLVACLFRAAIIKVTIVKLRHCWSNLKT